MIGNLQIEVKSMRHLASTEGELIRDFSLNVQPGRRVAFLGRSGVGKSTLLRIVAGLERRFVGSLTCDGSPVTGPSSRIQLLFQEPTLLPWKTVFSNVAFATVDVSGRSTADVVEAALSKVGLASRAEAWPKTLSGGEAARVALARLLIRRPSVLLLDEPLQSLDLVTKHEVGEYLFREIENGKPTVLMVSHSIEDAVLFADEVHLLSQRPMRIERTFDVPMPRPRLRGSPEVANLVDQIQDFLMRTQSSIEVGVLSK